MASTRGGSGSFIGTLLLLLVLVLVPILGHILLTFMILGDELSLTEKILWLVAVWVVWFVGPLLYLLIGQRRNRLVSRLSS
jgi:hypothetical protein